MLKRLFQRDPYVATAIVLAALPGIAVGAWFYGNWVYDVLLWVTESRMFARGATLFICLMTAAGATFAAIHRGTEGVWPWEQE